MMKGGEGSSFLWGNDNDSDLKHLAYGTTVTFF
jgi:hypothetical protein